MHTLPSEDTVKFIKKLMIFTSLDHHEQALVASRCAIIDMQAAKIVFDQGEIADTFYGVMQGTVLISLKSQSQGWMPAGTMGPGGVFGEIAILRNIPRVGRLTTVTPCRFLTLTAKDFLEIYQFFSARSRDNIQLIIAKRLARRESYIRI